MATPRRAPPEIPCRVAASAGLAPLTPRRVEREFAARLASGAQPVCDGALRTRPAKLLALGYRPRARIDLFDTTYYLSAMRQNEDLRFSVGYVALPARTGEPARIHARVFYKDVSLIWRAASHFARSEREN